MNIRDYLGIVNKDSNVNNNIKATAETEPEQFWPFNNGLTIITHDYTLGDDELIVTGLAIVNGAQTTGAIGNLQAEPNDSLRVAVRFYKASDQEFIEKIIHFTNSQNAIEAADFRSTDSVQRRLREELGASPALIIMAVVAVAEAIRFKESRIYFQITPSGKLSQLFTVIQ